MRLTECLPTVLLPHCHTLPRWFRLVANKLLRCCAMMPWDTNLFLQKIHDSLPVVWFYAVNQADTLTDVPYLRVPLYRTRDRAAHFIDAMYLKTCGDLAKWTLRGTAVLATVDGCSL